MKPKGFKKKGHTFSKEHAEYGEHYNIQGSAWNSTGSHWTFYINCAISFPDLPVLSPGVGMWKYHAHTRLPRFDQSAPAQYDVTETEFEDIVDRLGVSLQKCSEYFHRRHRILKDSYMKKLFDAGFPHDPEKKAS